MCCVLAYFRKFLSKCTASKGSKRTFKNSVMKLFNKYSKTRPSYNDKIKVRLDSTQMPSTTFYVNLMSVMPKAMFILTICVCYYTDMGQSFTLVPSAQCLGQGK